MNTDGQKIMSPQLGHIIAIKMNKRECYPKSLSEWLNVYFYTVDLEITYLAKEEMKNYNQVEDMEMWEKLYFSTTDMEIKELAFEILPNKKGFNKTFISSKNYLQTSLGAEDETIIGRYSLKSYVETLRRMKGSYETLEDLMLILSLARRVEKRVNMFQDSDLKTELINISIEKEILEYIKSCNYDLSNDLASESEDRKLCLLDLNNICKNFYRGLIHEEILKIITENLDRDFNSYVQLYRSKVLTDEISQIILSRIKSSKPSLCELIEVFEKTRNDFSETIRDHCLNEIIHRLESTES